MQLERWIGQGPPTGSEGPMARTITLCETGPVTIKPPINTLSATSTRPRVEMFKTLEVSPPGSKSYTSTNPTPVFSPHRGE